MAAGEAIAGDSVIGTIIDTDEGLPVLNRPCSVPGKVATNNVGAPFYCANSASGYIWKNLPIGSTIFPLSKFYGKTTKCYDKVRNKTAIRVDANGNVVGRAFLRWVGYKSFKYKLVPVKKFLGVTNRGNLWISLRPWGFHIENAGGAFGNNNGGEKFIYDTADCYFQ